MFKTQSFQNFNMLYDAFGDWRAKAEQYRLNQSSENRAALKEARGTMGRVLSAQVVSAAVLSAMTFVNALAMGRLKNYQADDDEAEGTLQWYSVLPQLLKDAVSAMAGSALGGSEAFSLADTFLLGGSWYDIEAGGVSSLNDTVQRMQGVVKAVEKLYDAFQDDEAEMTPGMWQSAAMAGGKLIKTLLESFGGIPATNVERILHAVSDRVVKKVFGEYMGEYWKLLTTADFEKDNRQFTRLAEQARQAGDPDYVQLRELINQLGKGGEIRTEKELRDREQAADGSEVNELIKAAYAAQKAGDADALDRYWEQLRALEYTGDEIEKRLHRESVKELMETKQYKDAYSRTAVRLEDEGRKEKGYEMLNRKQREHFQDSLNEYSRAVVLTELEEGYDSESESKMVKYCRNAQKECGLTESRFLVAYAATRGIDSLKDRDGETIANSRALRMMQAVNHVPGLNDRQRAYLYEACGVGKAVIRYNPGRVEQALREMERMAGKNGDIRE